MIHSETCHEKCLYMYGNSAIKGFNNHTFFFNFLCRTLNKPYSYSYTQLANHPHIKCKVYLENEVIC